MLNQVILVGRLQNDPVLQVVDGGRNKTHVTLGIQRGFKNAESGEYEVDYLQCTLWSGIAENTVEYCKAGSTVGIKARLSQKTAILADGTTLNYPEIIAEKITFINTKQDTLDEDES